MQRYDIDVDLRGLLEGEVLGLDLDDHVHLRRPGASTFVDCVAEVRARHPQRPRRSTSARVAGRPDPAARPRRRERARRRGRPDRHRQRQRHPAHGRPLRRLVYVWTSFEADDARRAWACFDQPDLKAPHAFTVLRPGGVDGHQQRRARRRGRGPTADGGRRAGRFPDTPPLSTYVVVVNAGPFHELRRERGGHSLGLYCRQSLRSYLERDADDLFRVTAAGPGVLRRAVRPAVPAGALRPGLRARHGRRDGELGLRHLDRQPCCSAPRPRTASARWSASVLLHEMAHMWFGDLVTMRWWDDLWLNEAFASWAATWAGVHATEFTDAWASFLAADEIAGYAMDMGPASPPDPRRRARRGPRDGELRRDHLRQGPGRAAAAGRHVGEDTFVEGLRAYFARRTPGATPGWPT